MYFIEYLFMTKWRILRQVRSCAMRALPEPVGYCGTKKGLKKGLGHNKLALRRGAAWLLPLWPGKACPYVPGVCQLQYFIGL